MTDRIYHVLFLCTGNSARSVLAESILRKDGQGRFNASAGALFTALPLASIDKMSLRSKLNDIGEGEGASTSRPQVA